MDRMEGEMDGCVDGWGWEVYNRFTHLLTERFKVQVIFLDIQVRTNSYDAIQGASGLPKYSGTH